MSISIDFIRSHQELLKKYNKKEILPFNVHVESIDAAHRKFVWWHLYSPYDLKWRLEVTVRIKKSWFRDTIEIVNVAGESPWDAANYIPASQRQIDNFNKGNIGHFWNDSIHPEPNVIQARLDFYLHTWRQDLLMWDIICYITKRPWSGQLKLRTIDEILYSLRAYLSNGLRDRNLIQRGWSRICVSETLHSKRWSCVFKNTVSQTDDYLIGWCDESKNTIHTSVLLKDQWLMMYNEIWIIKNNGELHLTTSTHNKNSTLRGRPWTDGSDDQLSAYMSGIRNSINTNSIELDLDRLWFTQTQVIAHNIAYARHNDSRALDALYLCTNLFLKYASECEDSRLKKMVEVWKLQETVFGDYTASLQAWQECVRISFDLNSSSLNETIELPVNFEVSTLF